MSDNLGATKNEIIEYYQDEVATLGREISAKDQRIAELEQERDALAAALSTHGKCIQCGGTGSYETAVGMDEDGEIQTEEAQCECRGVDPQAILAARLAEERKAGAVEALRTFGKHLERLGIEHVDEAAGCAIEAMALEAEVFAAQIERGEGSK
jgi:hypothetical protein